jgi:hypothetical protein
MSYSELQQINIWNHQQLSQSSDKWKCDILISVRKVMYDLHSNVLTVEVPIANASMSVKDVIVIATPDCCRARPNLSGTPVALSSLLRLSKH